MVTIFLILLLCGVLGRLGPVPLSLHVLGEAGALGMEWESV